MWHEMCDVIFILLVDINKIFHSFILLYEILNNNFLVSIFFLLLQFQHVFTGLEATKNHQGLVLFIEEDHYVTPDFYVMLKNMYRLKQR